MAEDANDEDEMRILEGEGQVEYAIRFGMKQPRAAGIVRRDSANDGHEHAKRLEEAGLMQELASGMQEPGMDDAAEAAGKEKQRTPSMRRRRRRRTLATAPRQDPAGTRGTTTPTRGEDLVGRSGARGTPTPTTTMPATSASSQPRRRLRRPPRHRCLLPTEAVAASSLLLLLLLLPAFAFRHRGRPPPLPARALRRVAPELVAEVPSARPPPPPPLALPFFLWAGWQKGFRHYFLAFHRAVLLMWHADLAHYADVSTQS
uniref:Fertility restorer-like n=1 Tax=Oryza sativa subsp. japonica TaxID=39947 RepID=Q5SND1_ORYSJ|nr:fertility restorer-like [Oryza sativa Japonica Group]